MYFKLIKHNGNYTTFEDPYDIYIYIIESIFNEDPRECSYQAHKEASEAQGWCELACDGDEYDGGDFTIECIEY